MRSKVRFYGFLYLSLIFHFGVYVFLFNHRDGADGWYICNFKVPVVLSVKIDENKDDLDSLSSQEKEQGDEEDSQVRSNAPESMSDLGQALDANPEKWKDLLERLEKTDDLRKNTIETFDGLLKNSDVSESYIRRKRQYEDIIVKDVFPSLKGIEKKFSEIVKEAPQNLNEYLERNRIIDDYRRLKKGEILRNRRRAEIRKEGELDKAPLVFPKQERQSYLDQTLPLPKETQLRNFLNSFGSYDPDKGDLPEAMRDLYYENLQRLAYYFSEDKTFFITDFFQENLNKEDFLMNSLNLVSKHKNTKLMSEILFALENIYEIQQRALSYFFQFDAMYPNLSEQKRKEIRVETLRRVRDRYKKILSEKNLMNLSKLNELYSQRRLQVMDFLLQHSPENYRRNDALFEKGRIEWEIAEKTQNEAGFQKAIKTWDKIQSGANDKDFLMQSVWKKLGPQIEQYKRTGNPLLRRQIHNTIETRLQEPLMKKKLREQRLLWKKKQK